MFKFAQKIVILSTIIFLLFVLLSLPFQWYKIGYYNEIFPALDLIAIYYLSTHKNLQYFHLFIIGLAIDRFYCFPIGTNSTTLVICHFMLLTISRWFIIKDYITNIITFCVYSIFATTIRYFLITIISAYHIDGYSIYFYLLTTIFSYPIIYFFIEKPINIISSLYKASP